MNTLNSKIENILKEIKNNGLFKYSDFISNQSVSNVIKIILLENLLILQMMC